MDDLTTERSFDSLVRWDIDVLVLFFHMLFMGFVQPGTGTCAVDRCKK